MFNQEIYTLMITIILVNGVAINGRSHSSSSSETQSSSHRTSASRQWKHQAFTFALNDSSLQINSTHVWPPYLSRSLHFRFRTDRPNGLLLFHTVDSGPQGYPVYEFFVVLEHGKIKVIHDFGSARDEFTMGRGLNNDHWHEVNLTMEVENFKFKVIIDGQLGSIFEAKSFAAQYPNGYQAYASGVQSIIFFGGLPVDRRLSHQHYNTPRYIGCLGYISFHHVNILFVDLPRIRSSGLRKGCNSACRVAGICSIGVPCINHYTHANCDCFATEYEDESCSTPSKSSVTLRGSSFIIHKAFNWSERSETLLNRLSVSFKTKFDTSLLMYAYGLYPRFNRLYLALYMGKLRFEIDFGDGPQEIIPKTGKLSDNQWHNVTIIHSRHEVLLVLDNHSSRLKFSGVHYLHLEPYIYVGGIPTSLADRSNFSNNIVKSKFAGCLKSVYFNEADILYNLRRKSPSTRYTGLFKPEFNCQTVDSLPLTFQTSWSYINITKHREDILDLSMQFKTNQSDVVLASGSLQLGGRSDVQWILHLKNSLARFSMISSGRELGSKVTARSSNDNLSASSQLLLSSRFTTGKWQKIGVVGRRNNVTINVNDNHWIVYGYNEAMTFNPSVIIGTLNFTFHNSTRFGLGIMGCVKNLLINNRQIDPRVVVNNRSIHSGKISLDECRLVNPCDYPAACEHNGICTVNKQGEADCNCTGTGYAGKTCHFALYKRTCEEYYLIGHRRNATYKIDIDRNGPLPPANVDCTMSAQRKETTIRHNLPVEFIVRKLGFPNYYIDIKYREFSKEMLKALIAHTKGCSQEVKYGCKRAPFGLSGDTWMVSASDRQVDSLGSELSGRCPCSTAMNCRDRSLFCNCDTGSDLEDEDSGIISDPSKLGIHRIFFRQTNMTSESEGRFTLSPLKCIDLSTQEHNITFKTRESFLELEGWNKGDLAFSFRTTLGRGIILYQAPLFPHHGFFRVSVISGYEMLFEYSVNGQAKQSKVISRRKLNDGGWQQVWVDYEARHMRFTVNLDSFMIDLDVDEEFDPFEGPLYIGGAPKSYLPEPSLTGFIGCFRGLTIDDRIIPLKIPETARDIEPQCHESCRPSPCQNGARCIEMWGNYECKCANPYAHKGKNCQHDINDNGITISSDNAFIHMLINHEGTYPVLKSDILLGFRTFEPKGLLLYANDHLNNFVQLHLNMSSIVFTYNSLRNVVSGAVHIGSGLGNGSFVQVQIVRQANETVLNVFTNCEVNCVAHSLQIPTSLQVLAEYYQSPWKSGSNLELVNPIRSFIALPSHTQFFIGGVDPIVNHSLPSFLGCISGLIIGDQPFDLQEKIKMAKERKHLSVVGDIESGCNRKCDQKPCENGGKCREDMRIKTIDGVSCDCDRTSYRGNFCEQDIGVKFDGTSVLIYNLSSYRNLSLDTFSIEFAFSAEPDSYPFLSGIKRLLLVFYHEYRSFLVALLSSGGLHFQEENGSGKGWRKIVQAPQLNFADGSRHWVVYNRRGENVTFKVDGSSYNSLAMVEIPRKEEKSSKYFLRVGGSLEASSHLNEFKTYVGCISNLRLSFGLGLEHIINPIESAFDGDQNVDVLQNGSHILQGIKQQRCSRFRATPKAGISDINFPHSSQVVKWSSAEPVKHSFLGRRVHKSLVDTESLRFYVFVMCLTFLGVVIGSVMIYMFRLQRSYELNKFRHETPFFNSHRNNPSSVPYNRVYQEERPVAVAKLLQYQSGNETQASELHPLQDISEEYEKDHEISGFAEYHNNTQRKSC